MLIQDLIVNFFFKKKSIYKLKLRKNLRTEFNFSEKKREKKNANLHIK
jgi:hypothetical protein